MMGMVMFSQKKENSKNLKDIPLIVSMRVMGGSKSGKSALVERYVDGLFSEASYLAGFDFKTKEENLNNRTIKVIVYDAKRKDRFSSIGDGSDLESARLRAKIVLFTMDVTDPNALNEIEKLLKEKREYIFHPMKILIATKVDKKINRLISAEVAEEFARAHDMVGYVETSAQSGINIEKAFRTACEFVLQAEKRFVTLRADSIEKKKEILEAVTNGDIDFIKQYCNDGKDRRKFIEIMTLAKDEQDDKNENLKSRSALLIAAKNKHIKLVDFIIKTAMQDEEGCQLLAEHLLEKNPEGKNVLHVAAFTPDNGVIIQQLCRVAKQLHAQKIERSNALSDYVNSKEDMRENTALHIAARQAIWGNYEALVQAGANTKSQANNGIIAIDLVKYNDLKYSVPFMKQWMQTLPEGVSYFKQRHGDFSNLLPNDIDNMIKIDLNAGLQDNSQAQLDAFKDCMALIMKAKTSQEYSPILSSLSYINFAVIEDRDLQDELGIVQLLKKIIQDSMMIALEDKELKNNYITAELLKQFKGISVATQTAFEYYSRLLTKYPQLALNGFKQLDLTFISNKIQVAKRLIVAHANISLNNIRENPTKTNFFNSLLKKSEDKCLTETLVKFLEELRNVTSIKDIVDLANALPTKGKMSLLKEQFINELRAYQLIAVTEIAKPQINI